MLDVKEFDDGTVWASVSRDRLDGLASLARQVLKCPAVLLVSHTDGRPSLRGACGQPSLVAEAMSALSIDMSVVDEGCVGGRLPGVGVTIAAPLHLRGGQVFGTICGIDAQGRTWSDDERDLLGHLADLMSDRIVLEDEANRRETQSSSLVDITHELRTPLQAIIGFTELLKIEQKPEIIAGHARTIQSAAESLLVLVNQTLDIAENEAESGAGDDHAHHPSTASTASTLDVHDFAETCLNIVRPLVGGKSVSLALDIKANVPKKLVLDAQKVQQALLNLLNNAIKFTDAGHVTLRIARRGQILVLSVVDTGIGIASDDHDLLFHRFSRIVGDGREIAGSGLGLSITRDLVESLAGRIGFHPTTTGGSNFWIELPLVRGEMTSIAPTSQNAHQDTAPMRRGARILLADDLDLNRKLIADMLSLDGHVVDCVADGKAAVAAAAANTYDLILMDMIMPVMDGLTATRAVRALPAPRGRVPIVALTANSFRDQLDACLEAGMDATLTKPMSIDALSRAVEEWTQRKMKAA